MKRNSLCQSLKEKVIYHEMTSSLYIDTTRETCFSVDSEFIAGIWVIFITLRGWYPCFDHMTWTVLDECTDCCSTEPVSSTFLRGLC